VKIYIRHNAQTLRFAMLIGNIRVIAPSRFGVETRTAPQTRQAWLVANFPATAETLMPESRLLVH